MKKLICLLLTLLILTGCVSDSYQEHIFYDYFDTVITIRSYANDSTDDFNNNISKIDNILYRWNSELDVYEDHEYEGLYKLNENAGISPIKVSTELMEFLKYSKEVYTMTNGKTNVMAGALIKLWKEAIVNNGPLPDEELIKESINHISIDSLVLDEENSTAYISDPLASIDAGAIGKGYVSKVIVEELGDLIDGYSLGLGGNITVVGTKASGAEWSVGIKDPFSDTNEPITTFELSDGCSVTSGNYERYFDYDGQRYHHIIDPDTGYPDMRYASITVKCKDPALADSFTTALFSMSIEEGKELTKDLDFEITWITVDGEIVNYN